MKKESNSALGLKWELETRVGGAILKNSSLREKNAACLQRQAQPLVNYRNQL